MKQYLEDIKAIVLGIIGLVGGMIWGLLSKWELEPLILICSSVFALSLSLFFRFLPKQESTVRQNQDIQTFNWITNILNPHGAILYLRYYEFGRRIIDYNNLVKLLHFPVEIEKTPWIKFFDPKLEEARVNLFSEIASFCRLFEENTFPARGNPNQQEIPPEWEHQQQSRYKNAVNDLNLTSNEVVRAYDNLIWLAHEILGVSTLPLP